MAWKIEYARSVQKTVRKLDPQVQRRIREYMEQRVASLEDPREIGERLKGQLSGLWRYRVGDYRIVCRLQDEALVILVVRVGHRKEVYQ